MSSGVVVYSATLSSFSHFIFGISRTIFPSKYTLQLFTLLPFISEQISMLFFRFFFFAAQCSQWRSVCLWQFTHALAAGVIEIEVLSTVCVSYNIARHPNLIFSISSGNNCCSTTFYRGKNS